LNTSITTIDIDNSIITSLVWNI